MSVSVFYYCLCAFRCHCFNPSLCHLLPFLLSYVAVSRSCQCQYFTIVFVLFSVAVTVLTHLCVICRHFCCPMLLFQGHVVCWNFTPTWASLKMKKWSSQCTQLCNCVKKPEKKKGCISLAFLAVRERNFNHGDDIFIYRHLYQPNKIVGNQTKVKYYLLFQYICYCKTRLHGPSKAASLS